MARRTIWSFASIKFKRTEIMSNELSSGEKTFLWTLGIVCGTTVLLAMGGGRRHRRRFHRRFRRALLDAVSDKLATEKKNVN
jgi:hypothetical protein